MVSKQIIIFPIGIKSIILYESIWIKFKVSLSPPKIKVDFISFVIILVFIFELIFTIELILFGY